MRNRNRFRVFMENFGFHQEAIVEREDPLSPMKITNNMRHFERDFRPVSHFFRNLPALSSWRSVQMTFCFFFVYMCTVWYSWTISFILLFVILRLSQNYLISKGWRIQGSIIPDVCEPLEHLKDNLNVFQMFHLAFDAAQKAQKLFGNMANILEKIKNLCMWVRPELTLKIYVGLWLAFIFSCVFPYQLLGFIIDVFVGIKFYIIDLIFEKFPKLRQRFDAPYTFWANLPTDLQLREPRNTFLSRWIAQQGPKGARPEVAFLMLFSVPDGGACSLHDPASLGPFIRGDDGYGEDSGQKCVSGLSG
ncbi:GRAM domain-containing protein 4-like [Xiphophorus hellerii]|uniref:GRAM domain-containing protein 4-like n=1 Tax=Xiphophorus hellerii TaxID=8084 RepID=UPI0013B37EA0|nr:GRAM domain-containing protein 4-like [Xiphophorus hellerii]